MKKLIIISVLLMVAANGCKTHKAIQVDKQVSKSLAVDSTKVRRDSIVAIKDTSASHVKKDDEETESYEETNVTITAPNNATAGISIPGQLHLDTNKSTLNNLVYTNDTTPKTTLAIQSDSAHDGMAKAILKTPSGTQVFQGWSSINIQSKKWTKTGKHLSDSTGNQIINRLAHNTFDSAHKNSVAKDTATVHQKVEKTSSTKGMNLNFIIIGVVALVLVAVLIYFGAFKKK